MGQERQTFITKNLEPVLEQRVYCESTYGDNIYTRLAERLLRGVGCPEISIVLWDKSEIITSNRAPLARIMIKDPKTLFLLLVDPEHYFGDLYSDGRVEINGDLTTCLTAVYSGIMSVKKKSLLKVILKLFAQSNNIKQSQKNIHHHYDIGNKFYQGWLDKQYMQYTCAYFPRWSMSLEQAQIAKMHHICKKLDLKQGQSVVEAGCGWGGLALFMAREYGVRVKAYNISHEQISYAKQLAREMHMERQVEYIEDDYRNIRGDFDAFVSIGMLEHVGLKHYNELGRVIDNSLKQSTGRGLIHTIGRNRPVNLNTWIQSRIFPGAHPPSLGQMMTIFEPLSFSILDVENLRLHYAKTLEHWLSRFNENKEKYSQDYDNKFISAWELYLAGSIAAFTSGTMQLFQVLFTRPDNNQLHTTREYIYEKSV